MATLSITTIQTNLIWENKQANLDLLQQKIHSIPYALEVVVLPEMFSTGFSMQPHLFAETMQGDTVNWMRQLAISKKIVLTGSLIIKEEGKYYNRLIWMLPNGQYGYYDKRHLFAFAGEDKHYAAGNKKLITSVKGFKINVQICYDLRFAAWASQQPKPQSTHDMYDVLLYVANWPEKRNHAWKTLLQARAIENQCYVVGVNRVGTDGNENYYSGDSMVVDPLGQIQYTMAHAEDIHTFTIEKETINTIRNNFPFWKDVDDCRIL